MQPIIPNLVSTIIPVYNRPQMLVETVRSVLAQTHSEYEIIIVDDGSKDETPAVADKLAAAHPDRIRVIHKPNQGVALARETGRLAARGEFIQYLDSDDLVLPRKYELQIASLRAHPECGVAYGGSRLVDEQGKVLIAPLRRTGIKMDYLLPALLVDRWWNTHTPLFRRSVCDAVGPWKDMRDEDWEYEARVAGLKTKLVHCGEYVSDYRQHTEERITSRPMSARVVESWGVLIQSLHEALVRAELPLECPEVRHFSRWAFLVARQCGVWGFVEHAQRSFQIALQTAEPVRRNAMDFRLYQLSTRVIGWRWTGRLVAQGLRCISRSPGKNTLPQTWGKSSTVCSSSDSRV